MNSNPDNYIVERVTLTSAYAVLTVLRAPGFDNFASVRVKDLGIFKATISDLRERLRSVAPTTAVSVEVVTTRFTPEYAATLPTVSGKRGWRDFVLQATNPAAAGGAP